LKLFEKRLILDTNCIKKILKKYFFMPELNFDFLLKIIFGLIPIFLFLIILIFLDSFKLVTFNSILFTIIIGCVTSLLCYVINTFIMEQFQIKFSTYSRLIAPTIEESIKSFYLIYLFNKKRIGFMVDGAIYGFAIGAGFALIENIYYLFYFPNLTPLIFLIRGFGTAIMHGGNVAIMGILCAVLIEKNPKMGIKSILPGLLLVIFLHTMFNFPVLTLFLRTIIIIITFPIMIVLAFAYSEKSLQNWLQVGFDTDVELLRMIDTGRLTETRIGKYLLAIKHKFEPEIVVDMLCLIRLYVELSLKAKGLLMLKEAGLAVPVDTALDAKFKELSYLEKNIGKSGKLALDPILNKRNRDIWQINFLNNMK
jgi:protease PrsW